MSDWKYYNHALIPSCAPHETPNIEELKDKKIWNQNGKRALFARWTTDWDCGYETDWWYVIKDEPFDISKLKKKRRYEINKGRKNFNIQIINPKDYKEEIYQILIEAYDKYPKKYRPSVKCEDLFNDIELWYNSTVFGAFKERQLCGYAILNEMKEYIAFSMLKVIPKYEKLGINAGMVYSILDYYEDRLKKGYYINDGSKNILHETAFQDYLEKYFEFRKAYCVLHVKYKLLIKIVINILFPIRFLIKKSNNKLIAKIVAVLKMEKINRSMKRKNW